MQQKLLLALLIASRKLRHYFQGHPITVVTSFPLEQILRNPNATDHVAGWNIELRPFNLRFDTTRVIKGRALADFVAEWTDPTPEEPREAETEPPETPCQSIGLCTLTAPSPAEMAEQALC